MNKPPEQPEEYPMCGLTRAEFFESAAFFAGLTASLIWGLKEGEVPKNTFDPEVELDVRKQPLVKKILAE